MIIKLSQLYTDKNINEDQKRLIETTLGAALWYLPNDRKFWTGKISIKALNYLKNKKGKIIDLTKDHEFPRKIAAKEKLYV